MDRYIEIDSHFDQLYLEHRQHLLAYGKVMVRKNESVRRRPILVDVSLAPIPTQMQECKREAAVIELGSSYYDAEGTDADDLDAVCTELVPLIKEFDRIRRVKQWGMWTRPIVKRLRGGMIYREASELARNVARIRRVVTLVLCSNTHKVSRAKKIAASELILLHRNGANKVSRSKNLALEFAKEIMRIQAGLVDLFIGSHALARSGSISKLGKSLSFRTAASKFGMKLRHHGRTQIRRASYCKLRSSNRGVGTSLARSPTIKRGILKVLSTRKGIYGSEKSADKSLPIARLEKIDSSQDTQYSLIDMDHPSFAWKSFAET